MDLARKSTIASTRTILCALVSLRLFICKTKEERKKGANINTLYAKKNNKKKRSPKEPSMLKVWHALHILVVAE